MVSSSLLTASIIIYFIAIDCIADGSRSRARKIRLNALRSKENLPESWHKYFEKSRNAKFQIIAAPGMENLARRIVALDPDRFLYHPTNWGKFPDGTDNIEIGGFQPVNHLAGENVLLLASFHNNDVTLSQFSVMVTLLQAFVESLTIVLPFYPVGTMERVLR